MDLPVRKSLPHCVPQWVDDGDSFFITINCQERGRNQLCVDGVGEAILGAAKFNHERGFWNCRLLLLMPDHLHGVIVVSKGVGLQRCVTNWKRFVANDAGVEWQKDFFDHRLRGVHELEEKVSYILLNPVRKGLCERVEDWPWVFRGERGKG